MFYNMYELQDLDVVDEYVFVCPRGMFCRPKITTSSVIYFRDTLNGTLIGDGVGSRSILLLGKNYETI